MPFVNILALLGLRIAIRLLSRPSLIIRVLLFYVSWNITRLLVIRSIRACVRASYGRWWCSLTSLRRRRQSRRLNGVRLLGRRGNGGCIRLLLFGWLLPTLRKFRLLLVQTDGAFLIATRTVIVRGQRRRLASPSVTWAMLRPLRNASGMNRLRNLPPWFNA